MAESGNARSKFNFDGRFYHAFITQLVDRLKRDPLGTVKRGFYHTFIGRFKYARGDDYDAQRFWQDRFNRFGLSYESVTDEVHSEAENREREKACKEKLHDYCRIHNVDLVSSSALDIGCGNGFYTRILDELGVKEYTGIDVTDALFPDLIERFPHFQFVKQDVTTDRIAGSYELVIMIDVAQHIVSDSKLQLAMQNIKDCLAENGVFIIAPLRETTRKSPFVYFIRFWSLDSIIRHFDDCEISEPIMFRDGEFMIAIRKR